ncbi:uncharacterized protein LOC121752788 [Salvia splendens]|uniref:uncharacterized protein LOC121752788 n=1 Tax=Salvia splendens TaxID=180675 RepID=UPI001C27AC3B|nr:uncharacterized protein LOC121752788 [Salvia splendens]
MWRELFLRVVNGLSARCLDFQQCWDATDKPGLSRLQKCTTAIRQLSYGGAADLFDEYLHVDDMTGRECLKKFYKGVIQTSGPTYLRKPTAQECLFLLDLHERVHDFSGMLVSTLSRLYELGEEELSDCLEMPVYNRVQRHIPNYHSMWIWHA